MEIQNTALQNTALYTIAYHFPIEAKRAYTSHICGSGYKGIVSCELFQIFGISDHVSCDGTHVILEPVSDHVINGFTCIGDLYVACSKAVILHRCHVSGVVYCNHNIVKLDTDATVADRQQKPEITHVIVAMTSRWADGQQRRHDEAVRLARKWLELHPDDEERLLRDCPYEDNVLRTGLFQDIVDNGAHCGLFQRELGPEYPELSYCDELYVTTRIFWEYRRIFQEVFQGVLIGVLADIVLQYIIGGFQPKFPCVMERRIVKFRPSIFSVIDYCLDYYRGVYKTIKTCYC